MRSMVTVCLVAVSVFGGAAGRAQADTKAELVSTAVVWDRANHVTNLDLIRFDDRWFLVCQESVHEGYPGGAVRVLTSKDGKAWEAVAVIKSPTPKRGLFAPTFTTTPDGQLMVSAVGFLPYPNSPDPVPEYGGLSKTLTWVSKDGRAWGDPVPVGLDEFPLGRVVWHNGTAFSPAIGRICGSAQTLQLMAGKDGKAFESRSEQYVRMLMPYEAELLFEGGMAYCLVTGYSTAGPTGVLGTAKAPYKKWEWKKLDQQVRNARFLRLPDKRVVATVGLYEQKKFRTALCEFHPATGKAEEFTSRFTPKGSRLTAYVSPKDSYALAAVPIFRTGEGKDGSLPRLRLQAGENRVGMEGVVVRLGSGEKGEDVELSTGYLDVPGPSPKK